LWHSPRRSFCFRLIAIFFGFALLIRRRNGELYLHATQVISGIYPRVSFLLKLSIGKRRNTHIITLIILPSVALAHILTLLGSRLKFEVVIVVVIVPDGGQSKGQGGWTEAFSVISGSSRTRGHYVGFCSVKCNPIW
jgi:hypothetical protein